MRLRKPGKIGDHLWLLGTPEACVYIVEGSKASAVINAGMAYILPDLLRQIEQFGIIEEKIKHLVILHAHFDHVGIAPFLKRRHPEIALHASAIAWDVLANTKALAIIGQFTRKIADRVAKDKKTNWEALDWMWSGDISGVAAGEGDVIDLGDRHIQIIETPGHSACSISAYVPQLEALFPSDAAAIPYGEEYIIAAGSSMEKFYESLRKLAPLSASLICADHYGVVTGLESGTYIQSSLAAAEDMQNRLMETLETEGSVKRAARLLVDRHFALRPDYFVHPDILMITYSKMLNGLVRS
ncbi:MAG: MBL fold metallo-hydrolase [Smithellaceae bacterium]